MRGTEGVCVCVCVCVVGGGSPEPNERFQTWGKGEVAVPSVTVTGTASSADAQSAKAARTRGFMILDWGTAQRRDHGAKAGSRRGQRRLARMGVGGRQVIGGQVP